jgi:hypothetical protein
MIQRRRAQVFEGLPRNTPHRAALEQRAALAGLAPEV